MSWQPIETAPKDQVILLFGPERGDPPDEGSIWIGAWSYGYWDVEGRNVIPTHWAPLPAPPQATDNTSE